jgi:hypothetical protein
LIGINAAAALQRLAAAPRTEALAPTAMPGRSAAGGSGTAPSAPSGPPCSAGASAAGGSGGLGSGGWAAIGVSPLGCNPSQSLHPHRLSSALWRPTAFVSLQERPG